MNQNAVHETHGPYRIVRNKDGTKTYFSGHYENGHIRWVEKAEDGVHYSDTGMAATVMRALKTDVDESLNVVRITG